ncbi:hypothetical protein PI126_g11760 [Phytophthora idaei]|nr:hypothetical protein PI126_g11760 [Phytophthora idaei]
MELGSNPTSQSAAPEDKCVKSEPHATTAVSSTPVPGLPRAKLHTAAQDFVPCRATMGYSAVRSHTCRAAVPAVSRLQDVTTAMMNRADTLAIEQVALPARLIWEALRYEFYGSGNGNVVRGLSEMQVQRRIYRARHQHFSGDVHGAVEIPPLSLALNEAVSFFQFHYRLADVPRGRVRRAPRERIQLPVPVEIPEDIADDSDSDEPLALEHASDSSLNEESNDDEEEGTGFSV